MKALIIVLFFLTSLNPSLYSQSVTGKIITRDSLPIPLATVTLLQDSVIKSRTSTDSNGRFILRNILITGKNYRFLVTAIGFRDQYFSLMDTNSDRHLLLTMESLEKMMTEVTVSATKPLVTHRSDRYIVNVENSHLSTGNSALEVLQRSPGIWVDGAGNIRLNGNQTVTVMINDVVQRLTATELADYLRSLRSEDISKIEVISNPPSEFEAAATGGIIHIVLKKSRRAGTSGNISAQYRQQQTKPFGSIGTSLDHKASKLYLFGSLTASIDQSSYTGWSNVKYPDATSLYNTTIRNNKNTRIQYRAGVNYDIHQDHSMNFQLNGNDQQLDQQFDTKLNYDLHTGTVSGNSLSDWNRKPQQISYTFQYNWRMDSTGSYLRITGDHTRSKKTEVNEVNSDYVNSPNYANPIDDQHYRTQTPSNTQITSLQTDFLGKIKNGFTLTAGLKTVFTDRNNTVLKEDEVQQRWVKDDPGSNEFRYEEKIWMFYTSLEKGFGKTMIKAGLRGEHTISSGLSITSDQQIKQKYFALFPSLFINRNINEEKGNNASLNYTRRIRRPGYNDLNPYRLQVHDFTVLTGNPDLLPQYTHSIRLAYNYHRSYTAAAYVQLTDNFIAQSGRVVDSSILEYRSENYPGNKEYGISLDATINISKIWSTQNSLMIYYNTVRLDDERFSATSARAQSVQTISFVRLIDIYSTLYYNIPYWIGNTKLSSVFYMDLGITRKIWKDRGRIRFYVSDIFNTSRERELTLLKGTRVDFYQKRPTQTFSLAFSYNFHSGKKFTRKNIDSHNTEEKNRL
jgi:hypothetical protein